MICFEVEQHVGMIQQQHPARCARRVSPNDDDYVALFDVRTPENTHELRPHQVPCVNNM